MIAGMQASTTSRVTTVIATPIVVSAVRFIDEKMALGTRDTMLTKMMSDMPLPMPRCVISSPIHMMNAVPATSVNTTSSKSSFSNDFSTYSWHTLLDIHVD